MAGTGRQAFGSVGGDRLNTQQPMPTIGRKSLGGNSQLAVGARTSLAPASVRPVAQSAAQNDRRQTLAAPKPVGRKSIGPSSGAGRTSMLPPSSRPSLAPNSRLSVAPSGRPSMAGAGGRMSMAPGGAPSIKVDPRPIKDKAYIQFCTNNLLEFLLSNGYDRPISLQNLASPSQQDFKHIVEFLFSRIDPAFKLSGPDTKDPSAGKKAEDEIPILFRCLKYPFQMSSRSLQSVGTAHTWPPLLAALHWVVELINYAATAERMQQEQQEIEEHQLLSTGGASSISSDGSKQSSMDRLFFAFVTDAYRLFMDGDVESVEKLEEEFVFLNQTRNQELAAGTKTAIEQIEQIRAETANLEQSDSRLSKLQQVLNTLKTDETSFKEYVAGLYQHRASLETAMRDRQAELAKHKADLAQLEQENMQLEATFAQQRSEGLDVDRMTQERSALEENLSKEKALREELEQSINETEMELSKEFEVAEQSIASFNHIIRQQGLVRQPQQAEFEDASSVSDSSLYFDSELRLNPYGQFGQEMLSQNVKTFVKPQLVKILQYQRDLQADLQEQLFTLREKKDQLGEAVMTERATLAELTQQVTQLETTYARTRDSFDESQRLVEQQLGRELEAAAKRRDECKARLHSAESQKHSIERQLAELRDKTNREMAQMTTTIMQVVDLIASHKQSVNEKLQELVGFVKSKKLEFDKLSAQQHQAHLLLQSK